MMLNLGKKMILFFGAVLAVVGLSVFTGCSENNYKAEADEQVYQVVDSKWQDEFGSKTNYKISDTESSPDAFNVPRQVPDSAVLGLKQAVAVATAHNREYQNQKEALYIKALDLRLTRHEFEDRYFASAGATAKSDRRDEVVNFEANAGFNRLLLDGTRVGTEITVAWADLLSGNFRDGLAGVLGVTFVKPLLRGSDRSIVMEQLTQAERDVLYQVRGFNRFRKVFVVSVVSQYYRVLELHDRLVNAKGHYDALVELYQLSAKLAGAGRVPQFELERIGQDILKARDAYILAGNDYRQALDEFKITLSLPTTAEFELDYSELDGLRAREMPYPNFSESEAVETALLRRLDMANSADVILDAQRKVYVAVDNLRAELNLVGKAKGGNRDDSLNWLDENYALGLELELPVDKVEEQNKYRMSLITLNQSLRNYDLAEDTIALEVRKAHRDLIDAAKRYRIQMDGLELARKRLNETSLLLQYGRVSTRRVLDAQVDLYEAKDAATDALIDYTTSMLEFYRDTGVLQVQPDGMWSL